VILKAYLIGLNREHLASHVGDPYAHVPDTRANRLGVPPGTGNRVLEHQFFVFIEPLIPV
jgi:hypothetical protein